MYKSAARANPALLKRIKCPVPCAYRLVSPKRDPHSSKSNNAAYQVFGYEAEGFSSGRSTGRLHHGSDRAPSLLVQWQKKWLLQASVFNKAGVSYARMFSDKSKGNGSAEKGNGTSSNPSRKQNAREPGCTSRKLSNKKTSEGHGLKRIVESNEANNATRKEHFNVRKTALDKRKREASCEATITKSRTQKMEKKMASVEPIAGKSIEESERLRHIQRKIIKSLERKWISWQNISDTLAEFPCDVHENTRDLLLDCIAARVKKPELSRIGESLSCTSNLILLQGQSGTEFYQEAFVRAIARQLQIALLVADNSILSAKDLKDDTQIAGFAAEGIKQNNNHETLHKGKKANLQTLPITSSKRTRQVPMLDLKRFKGSNTPQRALSSSMEEDKNKRLKELEVDEKNADVTKCKEELQKPGKKGDVFQKSLHNLNIGDDVRYKGPKISKEKFREKVKIGQEGFVTSISHSLPWKLCVKFHGVSEDVFCDAAELEKLNSDVSDEGCLARFPELPIEALCEMVGDGIPVIVHFPDIEQWFSSVNSNGNAWLFPKVKDLLSKVDGPVVFIASSYDKETSAPVVTHTFMEAMLQQIVVSTVSKDSSPKKKDVVSAEITNIFTNVIKFLPPNEPNLLSIWKKGLEENKKKVTGTRNVMLLEESLEKNCMTCAELLNLINVDVQLTSESADDVVGWARNMIYQCGQLQTTDGRLIVDKKLLERSLGRLKDLTHTSEDKISYVTGLVENEYEKCLVPSVILAHEIGVKFSEIGALEYVKSSLNELIVLPLRRPELFRKGNLRKPCKGVLLFGPPGTGKTLVAKAVATEAGANFLNISAATITSKYYGEDEKLVHAMFSLAKKLRPAVIFVDEVDSILGSRNDSTEHEAMRRIKNEFMAAWDGLQSNENEQILVFAATNRPFDLDDAVIRRLPRRIFVDLPNSENRVEILRVILANEDLDSSFSFESLALQTEGYSGSDLKNLCVAAAYVPVREFLAVEQEASKASLPGCCSPQVIRPLCMSDFLLAKAKIGASLSYDASAMVQLRQWNDQYGEGGSRLHKRIGFSQ